MNILLPSLKDKQKVADWLELIVLFEHSNYSKSKIKRKFENLCDNYDEKRIESDIDGILSDLELRKKYYGRYSPFEIDGNTIKPLKRWREIPEYIMCLIFSIIGVNERSIDDGTKLFEQLSLEVALKYLNGDGFILGFPNQNNLTQNINRVCSELCEKPGQFSPKPSDKDKGVDIIVWKNHKDSRSNHLILLLQCGAGKNWFNKKPIIINSWYDFINFAAKPLVTGIVIPIIISASEWKEYSNQYNLIFDRARILRLSKIKSTNYNLYKKIKSWCLNKIQ